MPAEKYTQTSPEFKYSLSLLLSPCVLLPSLYLGGGAVGGVIARKGRKVKERIYRLMMMYSSSNMTPAECMWMRAGAVNIILHAKP